MKLIVTIINELHIFKKETITMPIVKEINFKNYTNNEHVVMCEARRVRPVT